MADKKWLENEGRFGIIRDMRRGGRDLEIERKEVIE